MAKREAEPQTALEFCERAMANIEDPASAMEIFARGLARFPDDELLWQGRHALCELAGDLDTAMQCSERLIAIEGGTAGAWFRYGVNLQAAERLAEAEHAYRSAVAADPRHVDAWINLGAIVDEDGRHAEGLDAATRALEIDPDDAMAWSNRGNALMALARFDDAVAAYAEAAKRGFVGAVDRQRAALAYLGRDEDVAALLPQASAQQGELRTQTRDVAGRRVVARYFIGQHTNPELLDTVTSTMLEHIAACADVPPGIADGVTVQIGWPIVTLRARGTDLVVCEPTTARAPTRLRDEVSFTVFQLVVQASVCSLARVEPTQCAYPGTLRVQRDALRSRELIMMRQPPENAHDSGWRLLRGTDRDIPWEQTTLLSLAAVRPQLLQVVGLPIGYAVGFRDDAIVRLFDDHGTPIPLD